MGQPKKSTLLFKQYELRLVMRLLVFAYLVFVFVTARAKLSFSEYFGPAHGLNLVDVIFTLLVFDIFTKWLPNAKIAAGSLKQFATTHVPQVAAAVKEPRALLSELPTLEQATDVARQAIPAVPSPRELPQALRRQLHRDRTRQIVPVIIFWLAFNVAICGALKYFGWLNEATILLWTYFYAVFDMVCVVLWCPLQLLLMRNRCCTTCQIFNWDAIMTVTPLVLAPCVFSVVLLVLAAATLLRWEITAACYPERFDERTNAALSCQNCTDRLCHIRGALKQLLP